MNSAFEPIVNNVNDSAKKTWIHPAFELISKDVVKSGTNPGPESTSAVQNS